MRGRTRRSPRSFQHLSLREVLALPGNQPPKSGAGGAVRGAERRSWNSGAVYVLFSTHPGCSQHSWTQVTTLRSLGTSLQLERRLQRVLEAREPWRRNLEMWSSPDFDTCSVFDEATPLWTLFPHR